MAVFAFGLAWSSGSQSSHLTATGTPLPVPSPPASAAAPTPAAESPAPGLTPSFTTLAAVGSGELAALWSTGAAITDHGSAWYQIPVPQGISGIVVNADDPNQFLAGGPRLEVTSDAGQHWTATAAQPAPAGPFVPLLISPSDPSVLFASHQNQLAVSTDGGSSWRNVAIPALAPPVIAPASTGGDFFVAVGDRTFELTGNGAQVTPEPQIPQGFTVTALQAGGGRLVARADRRIYVLTGGGWNTTTITAVGPMAVGGTDIWAVVPGPGNPEPGSAPSQMVEVSTDAGVTWQARPGIPGGVTIVALELSADGGTAYALTSGGEVYVAVHDGWDLFTTGLQLAS